jgi:hypothetical protein
MEATAKLRFLRSGGRVIRASASKRREVWVLRKPPSGPVVRGSIWAKSLTILHQIKLRRAFKRALSHAFRPRSAAGLLGTA